MKPLPSRILSSLDRRLFAVFERLRSPARLPHPPPLRPLLLSGSVDFENTPKEEIWLGKEHQIPWHTDVVSGYVWPSDLFYTDIEYGHVKGVDVKDPWNRSRCHHLVELGRTYASTLDERYANSFVLQVEDWISKNPRGRGVNWVSPMEIAIRACNWLLAYDFFHESNTLDGFREKFAASLWDHGVHIVHRLEHGGRVSTNHYVANLTGLAYVGAAFEHAPWMDLAERELKREILDQTYADGFSYEASTAYHRLVTEMFYFSSVVLSIQDETYQKRLSKMLSVIEQLTDGSGNMPLIGDNDSGRLHSFTLPKPPRTELPSSGPSGLHVLKQGTEKLVFAAQPNGASGVGHHTHNDKLSFTLAIDGRDFFIDSGTAAYTSDPELRNLFRSTKMHSTITVDNEEQNRFLTDDLFALSNDAKAVVTEIIPNMRVSAYHDGYERLPGRIRHERMVEWKEGGWKITDRVTGRGKHLLEWNFILADGVRVVKAEMFHIQLLSGTVEVDFRVIDAELTIEDALCAPAYRMVRPTKKITLVKERELPFEISFLIKKAYK